MKTIRHLDTSADLRQHQSERLPVRDFADELRKEGRSNLDHHPNPGGAPLPQPQLHMAAAQGSIQVTIQPAENRFAVQTGVAPAPSDSTSVAFLAGKLSLVDGPAVQLGLIGTSIAHPGSPSLEAAATSDPQAPGAIIPAPSVPAGRLAAEAPVIKKTEEPRLLGEIGQQRTEIPQVAYNAGAGADGSAEWIATQEQMGAVVQPTGVTEALRVSRVFGVHLLASTYLSELVAVENSTPAVSVDTAALAVQSSLGETSAHLFEELHVPVDRPAPASAWTQWVEASSVLLNTEVQVATSESGPSSAASATSAGASQAIWPESSMRLTKQKDGSVAVWVRDYRMGDEGALRLVGVWGAMERKTGIRSIYP